MLARIVLGDERQLIPRRRRRRISLLDDMLEFMAEQLAAIGARIVPSPEEDPASDGERSGMNGRSGLGGRDARDHARVANIRADTLSP